MEKQVGQPEVIYNLETMTENRKNVLNIFSEMKMRYLTGNFTIQNLVKDYNYSVASANQIINTLAQNGLLNAKANPNGVLIYNFENDKQKQIENISLWKKRSELELQFFTLAIEVIENEIKNTSNLNVVK